MRHDGGNTLKSQDNHEGLRALPLNPVECGYFQSYHHWRTHRALAMDGSVPRPVQRPEVGRIREVPEVGGLHHHHER
jgi:hypothetical protein